MAEGSDNGQHGLVRELAGHNAWVVPALGVLLGIAGVVIGGWEPTIVVVIILLLVGNIALLRVWLHTRGLLVAHEAAEHSTRDDEQPSDHQEPTARPSGALPPEEDERESGDEGTAGPEPSVDDTPPWKELIDAAIDHDVARTRDAAQRFIEDAEDDDDRLHRRAWSLRMRAMAGETQALTDLERLMADNPTAPQPALAMAATFEGVSEFTRAVSILERAAESVREGRSHVLSEASRTMRRHGNMDRARELAEQALHHATTDMERAEAYQALGWSFWEQELRLSAFTAWENALRANPTDDRLRFTLAYRYSDSDLVELAMLHYEILTERSPAHPYARNNLGVVLSELNMRFRSAEAYRAAADLGESLPAANMASLMVGAGCAKEAEEWLEKGRASEDVHANINRTAGRLADLRESEDDTHDQAHARAQELRDLLTEGLVPTEVPTGRWAIGDDDDVELVADGDDDSVDKADFGVRYRFSRGPAGLDVTHKSGQYATKEHGMGVVRGGRLRFYLRSSSGETRLITGHPIPDDGEADASE